VFNQKLKQSKNIKNRLKLFLKSFKIDPNRNPKNAEKKKKSKKKKKDILFNM